MGLLDKAKKGEDKNDGAAEKKAGPEPKKHKKHPASLPEKQAAQSPDDSDDAVGQDESDGDQGQGLQDSGDSAGPAQAQDEGSEGGQQAPDQGDAQQGGQSAQGATPIPNPQAPGAGDDTSGGDDTPDSPDAATGGTPNAGAPSPAGATGAAGGPDSTTMAQVPLNPALKEAYMNLDKELVALLYQQGGAEHIVASLFAQGQYKIKGAVTASVTVARELLVKNKPPQALALPFARDVTAHILQIGEQVKGIQYSDQEFTAIFGAVYEGVMRAFGVKKSQAQHMQGLIPKGHLAQHAANYKEAAQHSQAAAQANAQQPHANDAQPQGPPPQAAGPQGPQGAGPSGGMLSQAQGAQQPQQDQGEEQPAEEQANG